MKEDPVWVVMAPYGAPENPQNFFSLDLYLFVGQRRVSIQWSTNGELVVFSL